MIYFFSINGKNKPIATDFSELSPTTRGILLILFAARNEPDRLLNEEELTDKYSEPLSKSISNHNSLIFKMINELYDNYSVFKESDFSKFEIKSFTTITIAGKPFSDTVYFEGEVLKLIEKLYELTFLPHN